MIDKFIIGRLKIAKDRICRPQSLGGLGMIDIAEFIVAQQVTWFKRAHISTRDNWRCDLKKLGNGNVLTVGRADTIENKFPIFKFLTTSFEKFLKSFNSTNDNFTKSYLLNNPSITRSRHDKLPININFFAGNIPNNELHLVSQISLEQISENGRLLSLDNIAANTGLNINLVLYLRRNVVTFENLIATGMNSDSVRKKFLSFWGFSFLPMNIREFSFKFFNNSLGLNQRLARYVGGRGEECTFCSIANNRPNVPETFIHFFFDCYTSSNIRNWFGTTYLPKINFNTRSDQLKFWFFGIIPGTDDNSNTFILALVQIFFIAYGVSKCKNESQ